MKKDYTLHSITCRLTTMNVPQHDCPLVGCKIMLRSVQLSDEGTNDNNHLLNEA
jgi:hypothetical protein